MLQFGGVLARHHWRLLASNIRRPINFFLRKEQIVSKNLLAFALIFFGSSMTSSSTCAAEELPKQLRAGEHRLVLNGSGARTKTFLELYVAGLYLTEANNNSVNIIEADAPMAIRIKITSSFVSQGSLVESLEVGFKNATGGDTREINKEIGQFREFFKDDIKKGDVFDMVYHPQHGVIVNKNGKFKGAVAGVKFKQALFSIWLSDKPADNALKQAMLNSPKTR